ncbi:hypothetical protein BH23THE1_BH23THE1_22780 [soil metagenome]
MEVVRVCLTLDSFEYKDFPTELKSSLPIKKKRNQILTYEEAVYNKDHSKRRI